MDLGAMTGLGLALMLLAGAALRTGSLRFFLDPYALLFVCGGVLAATLIWYPIPRLRSAMKMAREALAGRHTDLGHLPDLFIAYAERSRRHGVLVLENEAAGVEDPFLRKGLHLVVDGHSTATIRTGLEAEIDAVELSYRQAVGLFETMARCAPALGMLGTCFGVVQMLAQLGGTNRVGPGLAFALLSTLYGLAITNLLCLPVAGRLKEQGGQAVLLRQVMLEGILAIGLGEGPDGVGLRLKGLVIANGIRDDVPEQWQSEVSERRYA